VVAASATEVKMMGVHSLMDCPLSPRSPVHS
jgi:hypothetical protein